MDKDKINNLKYDLKLVLLVLIVTSSISAIQFALYNLNTPYIGIDLILKDIGFVTLLTTLTFIIVYHYRDYNKLFKTILIIVASITSLLTIKQLVGYVNIYNNQKSVLESYINCDYDYYQSTKPKELFKGKNVTLPMNPVSYFINSYIVYEDISTVLMNKVEGDSGKITYTVPEFYNTEFMSNKIKIDESITEYDKEGLLKYLTHTEFYKDLKEYEKAIKYLVKAVEYTCWVIGCAVIAVFFITADKIIKRNPESKSIKDTWRGICSKKGNKTVK